MTTKRARLRKPKSGSGITIAKSHNTRAARKAATAKRTAMANGAIVAAKKSAEVSSPVKAKAVKAAPVKKKK